MELSRKEIIENLIYTPIGELYVAYFDMDCAKDYYTVYSKDILKEAIDKIKELKQNSDEYRNDIKQLEKDALEGSYKVSFYYNSNNGNDLKDVFKELNKMGILPSGVFEIEKV